MSANDRCLELLDREFIKKNLPTLCGNIDIKHSDLKHCLISYGVITEHQMKKIMDKKGEQAQHQMLFNILLDIKKKSKIISFWKALKESGQEHLVDEMLKIAGIETNPLKRCHDACASDCVDGVNSRMRRQEESDALDRGLTICGYVHHVSKIHHQKRDNQSYFWTIIQHGEDMYQTVLVYDQSKKKEFIKWHKKQTPICLSNLSEKKRVCFNENSKASEVKKRSEIAFNSKAPRQTKVTELEKSRRFIDSMKLKCVEVVKFKDVRLGKTLKKVQMVAMMDVTGIVRLELWENLVMKMRKGHSYTINTVERWVQGDESEDNEEENGQSRDSEDEFKDEEESDDDNCDSEGEKGDFEGESDDEDEDNEESAIYIRTTRTTEIHKCEKINVEPCEDQAEKIEKIVQYNPLKEIKGRIMGSVEIHRYKRCLKDDCRRDMKVEGNVDKNEKLECPNDRCGLVNRVKDLVDAMYVKFKMNLPNDNLIPLICFDETLDRYLKKSCLKITDGKVEDLLKKHNVRVVYYINKKTVQSIESLDTDD